MDKMVKKAIGETMKKGEKMAPVKSIKLKIKFHKLNDEKVGKKLNRNY